MKHKIRVEMSTWHSTTTPQYGVRLAIHDDESGETIAHTELTPEQAWLLATGNGGSLYVDSIHTDHPERIGRKQVVRQIPVPREITDGFGYGPDARAQQQKWAFQYAREQAVDDEQVEVRSTNRGWVCILRSWPKPLCQYGHTEADHDRIGACERPVTR